MRTTLRVLKAVADILIYAGAFFADVPALMEWIVGMVAAGAALAASEPIGSVALVLVLLTVLYIKRPPIL